MRYAMVINPLSETPIRTYDVDTFEIEVTSMNMKQILVTMTTKIPPSSVAESKVRK